MPTDSNHIVSLTSQYMLFFPRLLFTSAIRPIDYTLPTKKWHRHLGNLAFGKVLCGQAGHI